MPRSPGSDGTQGHCSRPDPIRHRRHQRAGLDRYRKPSAIADVGSVVVWLTGGKDPDGANAVFEKDARELLEAVILDVLADPDLRADQRTLAEVYRRCTPQSWAMHLQNMELKGAAYANGIVAASGTRFATMAAEAPAQWQGVEAHLKGLISWLNALTLRSLCLAPDETTARTSDLLDGRTTFFVSIPLRTLDSEPAVARVIIGSLLNAVYRNFEQTRQVTSRVLFLLDELPRLKRMDVIQTARDAGRGVGITLWGIVQTLSQLMNIMVPALPRIGSRAHEW